MPVCCALECSRPVSCSSSGRPTILRAFLRFLRAASSEASEIGEPCARVRRPDFHTLAKRSCRSPRSAQSGRPENILRAAKTVGEAGGAFPTQAGGNSAGPELWRSPDRSDMLFRLPPGFPWVGT